MQAQAKEQETKAVLNQANTELALKKAQDIDTDNMFEAMAAKAGKLKAVQVD